MSRPMLRVSLLVLGVVALLGWLFWPVKPLHFACVQDGQVYTVGLRNLDDFNRAIDLSHARTVMIFADIMDTRQPLYAEAQTAIFKRRLRYEQNGMPAGDWPTPEVLAFSLEEMQKPKNFPLLIVSMEGVRRPGMLAAAYLASVKKLDKVAATQQLKRLYGDAPGLPDVLRFLDVYDPAGRQMKSPLPLSKE